MLPTFLRGQKHTPIPPIIAYITKKVNTTRIKIFLILTNKTIPKRNFPYPKQLGFIFSATSRRNFGILIPKRNIKNHSLRYCINEGVEERSYFILEFGERLVSNQTVADTEFRRKVAIEEYNRLRQGEAPTNPDQTLLGNFKSPNPSENYPYHSQRFKEQNAETLANYLQS